MNNKVYALQNTDGYVFDVFKNKSDAYEFAKQLMRDEGINEDEVESCIEEWTVHEASYHAT